MLVPTAMHSNLLAYCALGGRERARRLRQGRWGYRRVVRAFGTSILQEDGEERALAALCSLGRQERVLARLTRVHLPVQGR